MALAVEAPARDDMSLRTNDDKLVGARWLKSDGVTPVVITAATLTLLFEQQPQTYDADGAPVPRPPAERHVIDSTTPGDANGWIDAASLAQGNVLVTIPHTIWDGYVERRGSWDLVAVNGIQRCLVRGRFVAEEGVS